MSASNTSDKVDVSSRVVKFNS